MMQSQNNGQQSTAIAQRQDTQLEGVSLHESDIRPPQLSLVQAMSANSDQHQPGNFVRNDTDEEYESLEVTAIVVQANRTRWGKGEFSKDRRPLCFSPDNFFAAMTFLDGTETEFPGRECRTCEWFTDQPWRDKARDGYCTGGYFVIVMDVNTLECFVLRLNSTAAKLGKILGGKGIFRRKAITLYSKHINDSRGNFYEMQAKVGRNLDEGEAAIADELFNDLRHLRVTADDSEESDLASQQPSQPANPPAARISHDRPQPRQSRDSVVNNDAGPVYGADGQPVETEPAPSGYNPW